jgi:hypothetical protein
MSRQLQFLLVVVVVLGGCSTPASRDFNRGRTEAKRDVEQGHLVYWVGGLPLASGQEQARLLRDRYGIERQSVGCMIDRHLSSWLQGYRSVANVEMERRFGTNIWNATSTEAERIYEANKRQNASP